MYKTLGFLSGLRSQTNVSAPVADNYWKKFYNSYITKNIVEFLCSIINEQKYIKIVCDGFYLQPYEVYQEFHHQHPLLIYGYGLNEKKFYAADFFKNGKLSFEAINFNDFEKACNGSDKDFYIPFISIFEHIDYKQDFMKRNLLKILVAYREGVNNTILYTSDYNNRNNFKVGIQAMYETIQNNLLEFSNGNDFDLSMFAVYCDHIKVLQITAKYLVSCGFCVDIQIIADFNELYQKAVQYRNVLLKLYMKNHHIKADLTIYNKFKIIEENLLNQLINILTSAD